MKVAIKNKVSQVLLIIMVIPFFIAAQSSGDTLAVHPALPVNMQQVNTPDDDYWPAISADGEFFATTISRRGDTSGMSSQEDLAVFVKDAAGGWQLDSLLSQPLNTPFNEGSPAFSADGKYLFFVASGRQGGYGSCDIYYVIRHGHRWSAPIHPEGPLNTRFWESNPSLSADGRTLYFASNRPGGKGGMDIWKCAVAVQPDGLLRFFNVENMGDSINTSKNELSPCIHPDSKTLYFASDGRGGYGKNDVFVSRKNVRGQWGTPCNLGKTINTPGDDAGFVVEASGRYACFSSDGLVDNKRGRDIYRVELPAEFRPEAVACVKGTVADAGNGDPLRAQIELVDRITGQKIAVAVSDDVTGKFSVCYPAGKPVVVAASARPYLFDSFVVSDTIGTIGMKLQKIEKGRAITLKNVYFAFDSYELQSGSMPELRRLGRFLLEYPRVKIEVGGYTDNVGQDDHNRLLSERRAKAVCDFLLAGGIASDRIAYKGYGSSCPVATNDTEQGRALNRRTEVKIQ